MVLFKERLIQAMELRNIKATDLSKKTGLSKARISQYMSGVYTPKSKGTLALAEALNVSETWLMGLDVPMERDSKYNGEKYNSPDVTEDYTTFPVIGEIAAGYDKIAYEDWSGDTIDVPNSYLKGRNINDFFVLKVQGDSMYPLYHDGDIVLVLKQSTANYSGQVVAFLYDDEYATLKKVEYVMGEDWLRLVPINPTYKPELIEGERLEHCRVMGIPKLLIRDITE